MICKKCNLEIEYKNIAGLGHAWLAVDGRKVFCQVSEDGKSLKGHEPAQAEMEEGLYDRADSTPQNITCICGVTFRQDDLGTRQLHEECPKQRFINDSCPACGSKQHFHACPHRQKLNLQPANSTRTEMPPSVMDDHKGVQAAKKWMQELLGHVGIGHITYACFEDKSGKGWSVPQLLNAYLSHLAASVQQEPLNSNDDVWETNIHQQLDSIGAPSEDVDGNKFSINGRFAMLRLAAAPRTQGSELGDKLLDVISGMIATYETGDHADNPCGNCAICELEKVIAAQPQPAPRPPVCPNCGGLNVAFSEYKAKCGSFYCQFSGVPSEFFTAIPAQKEEK